MTAKEALKIVEAILHPQKLKNVQEIVFLGVWSGKSYEQIAVSAGYETEYIRHIGARLWQQLSQTLGEKVTKNNCRSVLRRWQGERERGRGGEGEQGEQGRQRRQGEHFQLNTQHFVQTRHGASLPLHTSYNTPHFQNSIDWGEAPDVSTFYGRTAELATLEQWVRSDRCRVVALLGMGGIGKTSLAVKLAQQVAGEFEYIIWRSLRNAPPLENLLADLAQFLSQQQSTQARIGELLHCLRTSRCLLILDNLETILQGGQTGVYRPGYEGYGELLRAIAETAHSSGVIVTSREKPAEVATFEGVELTVRSLQLQGSQEATLDLVEAKGLVGSALEKQQLGDRYSHNPLAVKIVATSIQDLFDGQVGEFLKQDTAVFNGVRRLLEGQFDRLSPLEQSIMYWLAINREWTTVEELHADIVPVVSKAKILEALQALIWRSLLERQAGSYTQQPVVMEFVTERLLEKAMDEIERENLAVLTTHALLKATAADYMRDSQRQSICEPLIARLTIRFGSPKAIGHHLQQLLARCQQDTLSAGSYGAGNLLNLLLYLKADLTGADLSGLTLRQVHLADTPLHQVNLSNIHLSQTRFADSLANIIGMDVSSNGLLAMTSATGMVFLYDLRTGQWVNSWSAHRGWVFGVVLAANGKTFFTGSHDQRIVQWDVATGQCLHEWQTDSPIWCLALSADGQWLASGHENQTARLWHLQTKQQIGAIDYPGAVRGLAFHPQTHHLATAGTDRTIDLWDCVTAECVATFVGHDDTIWDLSFSTRGDYLASASSDGSAKLWNSKTGDCLHTLPAASESSNRIQNNQINGVRFSPDARLLACACQNSTVQLWEVGSGKLLRTLQGHRAGVRSLAFSSQGDTFISGGEAAQVKIWQVESGHCLRTLQGKPLRHHTITLNPTGTLFVSGGDDSQLRLWSVVTGTCLRLYPNHGMGILTSAFHPEAERIATGSMNGLVKLWDFQGQCLHTCKGHENWVFGVVFHPTQPLVVSCGFDAKIYFWCMKTGNLVHTLVLPEGSGVIAIAFHPQGQLFASGSDDRLVRLWDDASKTVVRELSGHTAYPWCLTFHPQGELLASGAHDGTVKLWEVSSGNCVATFSELSGVPMSVNFSPDGRWLAAGCDRLIYIWDVSTSKCVLNLEGHSNVVSSVAFHPQDSSTLISASYDETIRFWNLETGKCTQVLRPDRIYEGTNIQGLKGLSEGQKAVLKQLGAVEESL